MSYYGEDCQCCQGLEVFLDPRQYTPQAEPADILNLPVWEQNLIKEQLKTAQEQAAQEAEEDVSVTSKNTLELVVQGLSLVNKNYVQIIAFQANSFYVKLSSLDNTWLEADAVSLIFTHNKLANSVIVPVLDFEKEVLVPNSVLLPGKLSISAVIMNNNGKISSTVTNSIDYNVYSPAVRPIDYNMGTDQQQYFLFLNTVKNLTDDYTKTLEKVAEDEKFNCLHVQLADEEEGEWY